MQILHVPHVMWSMVLFYEDPRIRSCLPCMRIHLSLTGGVGDPGHRCGGWLRASVVSKPMSASPGIGENVVFIMVSTSFPDEKGYSFIRPLGRALNKKLKRLHQDTKGRPSNL